MSKSSLNKLGVSSSKLAEIAYQESYNYYLSTKEKERAKIYGPNIGDYKKIQKDYEKIKRGGYNSPSLISVSKVPTPKPIIIFLIMSGMVINYECFSKVFNSNPFEKKCNKIY